MASDSQDREWFIRNILVECGLDDIENPALDGLELIILEVEDGRLDLEKSSQTTWTYDAVIDIPSSIDQLSFSAVSSSNEDIGCLVLKQHEWTKVRDDNPSGQYMKWEFEGGEHRAKLWLSLEVYSSTFDEIIQETSKVVAAAQNSPPLLLGIALHLPNNHPMKIDTLKLCGDQFVKNFKHTRNREDITNAIRAYRQAVNLLGDDSRVGGILDNMGVGYWRRYEISGRVEDLEEAISEWKKAIARMPESDPGLPGILNNLGTSVSKHFEHTGDLADISEAIQHQQHAVELTQEGSALLLTRLNNLATSFLRRFKHTGNVADVSEAIQNHQRVVELIPENHPLLPTKIHHLGNSFSRRFDYTQDLNDASQAIQSHHRAVQLTPEGHTELPARLHSLGNSFLRRFKGSGDDADVLEAIRNHLRAVQLTFEGNTDLPARLNDLGISFFWRFRQLNDLAASDLSEAIRHQQRAVQLTLDGDAVLPSRLINLGNSLSARFEHIGDVNDISRAIRNQQRAVELTLEEVNLPPLLTNLANSFLARFDRGPNEEDISQAIRNQQRAVKLTLPQDTLLPTQVHNLGGSLFRRFEFKGELEDLSESIQNQQRAIQLTPDGHARLPARLILLALSFSRRFERTGDHEYLTAALSNYRLSAMSSFGPPSIRLLGAENWAALSKRAEFSLSQLLDAHERSIHLLSLVTGLESTVERRHETLIKSSQLSIAASAAALSVNQPQKALEWLEQGRCIVWNQINQLRTPLDELRVSDPGLADRLSAISKELESAGSRTDPRGVGPELSMAAKISLEDEASNHLRLAKERDDLLNTIRNKPEFKNFLQPRECADLIRGLPKDGTVVIISVHEDRCDALALMANSDKPLHIPLERFSYKRATILAEGLHGYLSSRRVRLRCSPSDLRATSYADDPDSPNLQEILQQLWTDVVEPILDLLSFSVPGESGKLPRIWWCPTGPLTFLPLHAAGIYVQGKGTPGSCLSDFAISSYIPTLQTLLRERSKSPEPSESSTGLLMVSQPYTPGLKAIPCTREEVRKIIEEQLKTEGTISLVLDGREGTVDRVLRSMESYPSIHLACHASQDLKNPLASAIHLHDGTLELSAIIKKNHPNADFAFLSACQTSTGDTKLPDEAVHLAAGMLAAGYRSVVATMWSIFDTHAPQVAGSFYKNLLSERGAALDGAHAARALHYATQNLRETIGDSRRDPLLAWVPYIHLGI